jgi:hypothetical protein
MKLSKWRSIVRYQFNDRSLCIFLAIFLILSISLFIKLHVDKHLSLDGVNYFFHILENRGFANIAWSRRFTEYITEWPLVLAVQVGITDIPTLIDIFSIGIYLPYLLSFLLCLYAVRDEEKSLLWFPLAGYFGFNVLSDYDLIADHHVMAVTTWPILLILLKSRALFWREGILLWLLLVLYSRMYETAVLTAALLLLIVLIRLYRYPEQRERIILGGSIVLLVVVMVIASVYIVDPRSPQNRGSFLDSILVNKRNWEALATSGFMAIFSVGWIISERWAKTRNFLFLAALLPISYYTYSRLTTDYAMTAYISFSSRSLAGVVIPGLIVLAAIVAGMRRKLNGVGIGSFAAAALVMTGFNMSDLRYWIDVKEEFLRVGSSEARYISIEDTSLHDSHYRWSWNNSLLSLVWSSPCVDTIVLNGADDPQGPINPREHLVLRRYLKYDSYFLTVDSDISVCGR